MKVDRFKVDFLWRSQHLVVEMDGWESHRTRSAFEEDRARDARLKLLGYDVLRFTWRQVEIDGRSVARTVRSLLLGHIAQTLKPPDMLSRAGFALCLP